MSKEVKRYDPEGYSQPARLSGSGTHMNENPQGDYVLASDFDTLLAERDALKKDAERYRLRLETIRALYPDAPTDAELDIAIDAALQGEQP